MAIFLRLSISQVRSLPLPSGQNLLVANSVPLQQGCALKRVTDTINKRPIEKNLLFLVSEQQNMGKRRPGVSEDLMSNTAEEWKTMLAAPEVLSVKLNKYAPS